MPHLILNCICIIIRDPYIGFPVEIKSSLYHDHRFFIVPSNVSKSKELSTTHLNNNTPNYLASSQFLMNSNDNVTSSIRYTAISMIIITTHLLFTIKIYKV